MGCGVSPHLFSEDIKQERMYVLQKDARILAAFALCEHNKGEQHVDWHLSGQKALYLDRLGVHVDAMGKGVGRAAIREAMRCAKERQADVYGCLRWTAIHRPSGCMRKTGLFRRRASIMRLLMIADTVDWALKKLGTEKNCRDNVI